MEVFLMVKTLLPMPDLEYTAFHPVDIKASCVTMCVAQWQHWQESLFSKLLTKNVSPLCHLPTVPSNVTRIDVQS